MLRNGVVTAALIGLVVGCGGPSSRRADPTDEGIIKAGAVQGNEIEEATLELCNKVSQRTARGWPEYVLMTDDPDYPRPLVRVGEITNRTRRQLDMTEVVNEITNAL